MVTLFNQTLPRQGVWLSTEDKNLLQDLTNEVGLCLDSEFARLELYKANKNVGLIWELKHRKNKWQYLKVMY